MPEDTPTDPADAATPRSQTPAWPFAIPEPAEIITAAVVAAATIFVFVQLSPSLLFADTTPNGGDMGAHVWAPAFLRDELLPHFRLSGWTPDWYAGFPAMHFYMVLPMLAIVALDVVLPYGVAFKLVTVSGVVAMPVCAYAMARMLRLPHPAPALFSVGAVAFVFDRSFTIYGGNAASTLAGEFAFSISLALSLLFIGVFARAVDTGRYRARAAVLLALTALTHLIPALFAGLAAMLIWLMRVDRRSTITVAQIGAVGGALGAFWALPFIWRRPYLNDMGWVRLDDYAANLVPSDLRFVALLAAAGAMASLLLRRRGGILLLLMALALAVAFMAAPQGRLWNARLLPFLYLTVYLLAAIGAAELIRDGASALAGGVADLARSARVVGLVVAWLVAFILIGTPLRAVPSWLPGPEATSESFVKGWARWNYAGYERKPSYPEYAGIVIEMDRLGSERGCGRAMWEYDRSLDRYGTPMALMLLPHWTDGCIGSMEGLYFEASATTPFHFLNQSELSARPSRPQRGLPYRTLFTNEDVDADGTTDETEGTVDPAVFDAGIRHLQLYGVRYYMAFTPAVVDAAQGHRDLTLVGGDGPWEVFEIADGDLVAPLSYEPVVVTGADTGGKSWLDLAVDHYHDADDLDVPIAADGPRDWQRLSVGEIEGMLGDTLIGGSGSAAPLPRRALLPTTVSDIEAGVDTVSFRVDRVGVPVLVKVSYFPNWTASGADGPYRVTPNLMVVVPTDEEVRLHYSRTPVDHLANVVTLGGIGAAGWLAQADRRRRRGEDHHDDDYHHDDDEDAVVS
ncbi:MAG TPA: hypothetical protein VGA13_06855 [Acidimicrobiales bacterium]